MKNTPPNSMHVLFTRKDFIKTTAAALAVPAVGRAFADGRGIATEGDYPDLTGRMFMNWVANGSDHPVLKGLDATFDKTISEIRNVKVTDKPAVWFIYNMGVVVKTPQACFSIDLMHHKACELAPLLDFALITHNHLDHYTEAFYRAMNRAGKTVITNFKDNYGARGKGIGGFTRAVKTFNLKDVAIKTNLVDHNPFLIDFTTAFEIKTCGFRILHSGDCGSVSKLNPEPNPDIWFVHPRSCMKVADGIKKFAPKLTAIVHINELGHDKWRFTWKDGEDERKAAEAAGGKAIVPRWGDRIC